MKNILLLIGFGIITLLACCNPIKTNESISNSNTPIMNDNIDTNIVQVKEISEDGTIIYK